MQHPIMPHCNAHAAPLKSPIAPPRHALRACFCASLVLMAELCSANLLAAAVPTEWTVRIGPRSASYQAERRHGDALDLRATLTYNGQPLAYTGPARLYAQTNGMGSAWWDLAPCTVSSNVLQATWLPSFDTGADVVDIFLGGPSNYQAAARIRFLPSPGSVPNSLPLPAPTLDFATVQILNPPYYTRQETDSAIESAAPGNYSTVSNRAMSAIQEHQSLEPSTNYTDRTLGAFAATGTVARARGYGSLTRWTDATGCVWEVSSRWVCTDPGAEWTYTIDGETYTHAQMIERAGGEEYSQALVWSNENFETIDGGRQFEGWFVMDGSGTAPVGYDFSTDTIPDYASDPLLAHVTYYDGITATRGSLVTVTNLITRVAYTNDTAPLAAAVTNLQVESALVYRLYSGSNVVAEVTNYNSQVHAPTLRLMQLNESNEYVTVWTETNGLARTLRDATNYAASAIADYAAPRAWSATTSGLGAEAPANTTWISTPTTVIAGGLEYAKFVDTYGEVWVLTSNGMAAEFNPDTNAYFRITAYDGTPVFSIEKSDAQLVGANAAGITVGETTITIPVPVVSSTAPTMYWRSSLTSGDWADESAVNPNYMSVGWTGGPGSWVCTISFDGTRPSSMFFKFNFLQEGGVVIRNNATTDLSTGIWVNGVKFVPSVSGNNLIWTKQ